MNPISKEKYTNLSCRSYLEVLHPSTYTSIHVYDTTPRVLLMDTSMPFGGYRTLLQMQEKEL